MEDYNGCDILLSADTSQKIVSQAMTRHVDYTCWEDATHSELVIYSISQAPTGTE
jgi:hypothetical protein